MNETPSIDVERLMERIRENLRQRRLAEVGPSSETPAVPSAEDQAAADLAYLGSAYDIQSVPIASHRRVIGPLVVTVKHILRRLLASFLDRQTAYNAANARVAAHITGSIELLDRRQARADQELKGWIERIETGQARIQGHHTELQERVSGLEARLGQEVAAIESCLRHILAAESLHVVDARPAPPGRPEPNPLEKGIVSQERDVEAAGVEKRSEESEKDVKARQRAYIQYFEGRDNVIHLGCGPGEFPELLRESGITARGIDVDLDMIALCHEKGPDTSRQDVFAGLRTLRDDSVSGIFVAQVVGRLDPRRVIELIELCFVKLAPGGVLVFELPSRERRAGSADSSCKGVAQAKPLHPDTMQFAFEATGFHEVEVRFSGTERFTHGIERLNSLLFSSQDCAVIGRRIS